MRLGGTIEQVEEGASALAWQIIAQLTKWRALATRALPFPSPHA